MNPVRIPTCAALLASFLAACGGGATSNDPCAADPSKCPCTSDSTCKGATPRCDSRTGACVPCLPTADNCPADQHCVSTGNAYACVPKSSCTAVADCPMSGNLQGLCCSGTCADPLNDTNHCGTCGNACGAVPNGTGGCVNGSCGVVTCNMGFGDCDKKPANGCETDLNSTVNHCGVCEINCKPTPNTKAACTAGQCQYECNANFADCDANPANGCETSTDTNPMNCGACGKVCDKLPNTTDVACVDRACVVARCAPNFIDCNKQAVDGCEADTQNDAANCGGCNRKCPAVQNGAAGCLAGTCGVGKCNAGFDDCDRNVLNGCEQDLLSDPKNCGACGVVCTFANGAGVCQAGKCVLQACNQGWADCDLNAANGCEVNTVVDLKNCGQCANACKAPVNATASCSQGVCGIGSCMYGWADCNKNLNDGCETNVLTVQNCGACGNTCAQLQNASVTCPQGQCAIGMCNPGFADCDMKAFNGCEINTVTDLANCGACGNACPSKLNQVPTCTLSKCGLGACVKGFTDCNNNPADGCEADTANDANNCGACGVVCPQNTPFCRSGACIKIPCQRVGWKSGNANWDCPQGFVMPTVNDWNLVQTCVTQQDQNMFGYYNDVATVVGGCNCKWNNNWCGQPSIETIRGGRMCGDYQQLHICVSQ